MAVTKETLRKIEESESRAINAYEKIITSWIKSGKVVYPDNYGGSYLGGDKKLVIKLVGDAEETKQHILQVVCNDDIVRFESAPVSRAELHILLDAVPNLGIASLNSAWISYFDSKVHIQVSKKCQTLNFSERIVNGDRLVVEYAEELVPQYTCQPGGAIYVNRGIYYGTIGWQGTFRFNSETQASKCMLTAGHIVTGLQANGYALYLGGEEVLSNSQVQSSQYSYTIFDHPAEGNSVFNGDYGFFKMNDSMVQTNTVLLSPGVTEPITAISPYSSIDNFDALPGITVIKGQGRSDSCTGTLSAEAVALGVNYYESTLADGRFVTVRHLLVVESTENRAFSIPGDSGCPVFYKSGSSSVLLGIVVFGPETISTAGDSMLQGIADIRNAVAFSPYLG